MKATELFFVLMALALALFFLLRAIRPRSQSARPPHEPFNKMELAEEITPVVKPMKPLLPPPELPQEYNDTRVVLLVRDPEWLFAYWEIGEDNWNNLWHEYGKEIAAPQNIALRVFEMSNEMGFFDINVGQTLGDWHIKVGKPQTPFYCLLGLRWQETFIPLAVSNTVVTPRNDLSPFLDEDWMLVNDYEQRLLKRIGEIPIDLTSPFMFRKD